MSKSCSVESAIRIILTTGLAEFSLCAASLGATPANTPDSQGAEESAVIQEIVVTATRREENISKVPISITALSGPQLEERGITSVTSLVGEVPGVSMKSNGPVKPNSRCADYPRAAGRLRRSASTWMIRPSLPPRPQ